MRTLCSAPHLESVLSALLRCHVISHCGFDYHLKTVKAEQTSFPYSFAWAKSGRSILQVKLAAFTVGFISGLPINCFWVMFFSVIFSGSENVAQFL